MFKINSLQTLWRCGLLLSFCFIGVAQFDRELHAQEGKPWSGLRIVDSVTGRGVPLVELESTHSVRWVSDNAGHIYIDDDDLIGRSIFFYVHGHGYEVNKDGFGYSGVRVDLTPGAITDIAVKRTVLAERLVRLTGIGQLRDSRLLGLNNGDFLTPLNGEVVGQDSIQAVKFRDEVLCIWGDTSQASYPLGLFRAAGALAPWKNASQTPFDPAYGVPYRYFVETEKPFVRAMMPLRSHSEGVIWLDGLAIVDDDTGSEQVVAHYSRRAGLADELEHGIAKLNTATMEFEDLKRFETLDEWRHPYGHAQRVSIDGTEWIVFGNPFPNVRVPATLSAVQNPAEYEMLTPLSETGDRYQGWGWKKGMKRFEPTEESKWYQQADRKDGLEPRMLPLNALAESDRILFHNGSFAWNEYRKKWIVLGGRIDGKDSMLGEVWYSESTALEGPYTQAIQVATHSQQSYYNVCHHPFWDRDGGKTIYFEGTFTSDFSGNPYKTPRYNYNQILYRLDLEKVGQEAGSSNE
jgi:hypothetical protein